MLYVLEQGPTEQRILEQCLRERRPLPQAIQNAPVLEPGLELYYVAYLDLQTNRQVGFSEGPVPWLAVNEYAKRYGLDEEQHDDLQFFVRKMDEQYIKFHRERAERERQAKATQRQERPSRGLPRRR